MKEKDDPEIGVNETGCGRVCDGDGERADADANAVAGAADEDGSAVPVGDLSSFTVADASSWGCSVRSKDIFPTSS